MNTLTAIIRPALVLLLLFTVLTGLAFPLAVTGIAQAIFNDQANGSIVSRDGEEIGSTLIGQSFVDAENGATLPGYFRGRPSAAGDGYDASISSGSNYGPTSDVLRERIAADASQIRSENGLAEDAALPVDLVTASGSGLDPHISPASAELQVARVARERGLPEGQVRDLVQQHTADPILGLVGVARVNVLELNIALDAAAPVAP
ncbi:MAG: potassium-transporting ATPase subunit KdpC [Thermomicrobiales bacterium]